MSNQTMSPARRAAFLRDRAIKARNAAYHVDSADPSTSTSDRSGLDDGAMLLRIMAREWEGQAAEIEKEAESEGSVTR